MEYSFLDFSNDLSNLSNEIGRFKKQLCEEFEFPCQDVEFKFKTPIILEFNTLDSIQQILLLFSMYVNVFFE